MQPYTKKKSKNRINAAKLKKLKSEENNELSTTEEEITPLNSGDEYSPNAYSRSKNPYLEEIKPISAPKTYTVLKSKIKPNSNFVWLEKPTTQNKETVKIQGTDESYSRSKNPFFEGIKPNSAPNSYSTLQSKNEQNSNFIWLGQPTTPNKEAELTETTNTKVTTEHNFFDNIINIFASTSHSTVKPNITTTEKIASINVDELIYNNSDLLEGQTHNDKSATFVIYFTGKTTEDYLIESLGIQDVLPTKDVYDSFMKTMMPLEVDWAQIKNPTEKQSSTSLSKENITITTTEAASTTVSIETTTPTLNTENLTPSVNTLVKPNNVVNTSKKHTTISMKYVPDVDIAKVINDSDLYHQVFSVNDETTLLVYITKQSGEGDKILDSFSIDNILSTEGIYENMLKTMMPVEINLGQSNNLVILTVSETASTTPIYKSNASETSKPTQSEETITTQKAESSSEQTTPLKSTPSPEQVILKTQIEQKETLSSEPIKNNFPTESEVKLTTLPKELATVQENLQPTTLMTGMSAQTVSEIQNHEMISKITEGSSENNINSPTSIEHTQNGENISTVVPETQNEEQINEEITTLKKYKHHTMFKPVDVNQNHRIIEAMIQDYSRTQSLNNTMVTPSINELQTKLNTTGEIVTESNQNNNQPTMENSNRANEITSNTMSASILHGSSPEETKNEHNQELPETQIVTQNNINQISTIEENIVNTNNIKETSIETTKEQTAVVTILNYPTTQNLGNTVLTPPVEPQTKLITAAETVAVSNENVHQQINENSNSVNIMSTNIPLGTSTEETKTEHNQELQIVTHKNVTTLEENIINTNNIQDTSIKITEEQQYTPEDSRNHRIIEVMIHDSSTIQSFHNTMLTPPVNELQTNLNTAGEIVSVSEENNHQQTNENSNSANEISESIISSSIIHITSPEEAKDEHNQVSPEIQSGTQNNVIHASTVEVNAMNTNNIQETSIEDIHNHQIVGTVNNFSTTQSLGNTMLTPPVNEPQTALIPTEEIVAASEETIQQQTTENSNSAIEITTNIISASILHSTSSEETKNAHNQKLPEKEIVTQNSLNYASTIEENIINTKNTQEISIENEQQTNQEITTRHKYKHTMFDSMNDYKNHRIIEAMIHEASTIPSVASTVLTPPGNEPQTTLNAAGEIVTVSKENIHQQTNENLNNINEITENIMSANTLHRTSPEETKNEHNQELPEKQNDINHKISMEENIMNTKNTQRTEEHIQNTAEKVMVNDHPTFSAEKEEHQKLEPESTINTEISTHQTGVIDEGVFGFTEKDNDIENIEKNNKEIEVRLTDVDLESITESENHQTIPPEIKNNHVTTEVNEEKQQFQHTKLYQNTLTGPQTHKNHLTIITEKLIPTVSALEKPITSLEFLNITTKNHGFASTSSLTSSVVDAEIQKLITNSEIDDKFPSAENTFIFFLAEKTTEENKMLDRLNVDGLLTRNDEYDNILNTLMPIEINLGRSKFNESPSGNITLSPPESHYKGNEENTVLENHHNHQVTSQNNSPITVVENSKNENKHIVQTTQPIAPEIQNNHVTSETYQKEQQVSFESNNINTKQEESTELFKNTLTAPPKHQFTSEALNNEQVSFESNNINTKQEESTELFKNTLTAPPKYQFTSEAFNNEQVSFESNNINTKQEESTELFKNTLTSPPKHQFTSEALNNEHKVSSESEEENTLESKHTELNYKTVSEEGSEIDIDHNNKEIEVRLTDVYLDTITEPQNLQLESEITHVNTEINENIINTKKSELQNHHITSKINEEHNTQKIGEKEQHSSAKNEFKPTKLNQNTLIKPQNQQLTSKIVNKQHQVSTENNKHNTLQLKHTELDYETVPLEQVIFSIDSDIDISQNSKVIEEELTESYLKSVTEPHESEINEKENISPKNKNTKLIGNVVNTEKIEIKPNGEEEISSESNMNKSQHITSEIGEEEQVFSGNNKSTKLYENTQNHENNLANLTMIPTESTLEKPTNSFNVVKIIKTTTGSFEKLDNAEIKKLINNSEVYHEIFPEEEQRIILIVTEKSTEGDEIFDALSIDNLIPTDNMVENILKTMMPVEINLSLTEKDEVTSENEITSEINGKPEASSVYNKEAETHQHHEPTAINKEGGEKELFEITESNTVVTNIKNTEFSNEETVERPTQLNEESATEQENHQPSAIIKEEETVFSESNLSNTDYKENEEHTVSELPNHQVTSEIHGNPEASSVYNEEIEIKHTKQNHEPTALNKEVEEENLSSEYNEYSYKETASKEGEEENLSSKYNEYSYKETAGRPLQLNEKSTTEQEEENLSSEYSYKETTEQEYHQHSAFSKEGEEENLSSKYNEYSYKETAGRPLQLNEKSTTEQEEENLSSEYSYKETTEQEYHQHSAFSKEGEEENLSSKYNEYSYKETAGRPLQLIEKSTTEQEEENLSSEYSYKETTEQEHHQHSAFSKEGEEENLSSKYNEYSYKETAGGPLQLNEKSTAEQEEENFSSEYSYKETTEQEYHQHSAFSKEGEEENLSSKYNEYSYKETAGGPLQLNEKSTTEQEEENLSSEYSYKETTEQEYHQHSASIKEEEEETVSPEGNISNMLMTGIKNTEKLDQQITPEIQNNHGTEQHVFPENQNYNTQKFEEKSTNLFQNTEPHNHHFASEMIHTESSEGKMLEHKTESEGQKANSFEDDQEDIENTNKEVAVRRTDFFLEVITEPQNGQTESDINEEENISLQKPNNEIATNQATAGEHQIIESTKEIISSKNYVGTEINKHSKTLEESTQEHENEQSIQETSEIIHQKITLVSNIGTEVNEHSKNAEESTEEIENEQSIQETSEKIHQKITLVGNIGTEINENSKNAEESTEENGNEQSIQETSGVIHQKMTFQGNIGTEVNEQSENAEESTQENENEQADQETSEIIHKEKIYPESHISTEINEHSKHVEESPEEYENEHSMQETSEIIHHKKITSQSNFGTEINEHLKNSEEKTHESEIIEQEKNHFENTESAEKMQTESNVHNAPLTNESNENNVEESISESTVQEIIEQETHHNHEHTKTHLKEHEEPVTENTNTKNNFQETSLTISEPQNEEDADHDNKEIELRQTVLELETVTEESNIVESTKTTNKKIISNKEEAETEYATETQLKENEYISNTEHLTRRLLDIKDQQIAIDNEGFGFTPKNNDDICEACNDYVNLTTEVEDKFRGHLTENSPLGERTNPNQIHITQHGHPKLFTKNKGEEGEYKKGEHNKSEHKEGEHKEGVHKGGEHKEDEHKEGEQEEGEEGEGGELKEGKHKENEHKESEHNEKEEEQIEEGEHKKGEHKEGEHNEGKHKEGEHNEGEHREGKHKQVGHKEGEHKEEEHEHKESEHQEGENKEENQEGEHNEGENKEEETKEGEHNEGEHNGGEHKQLEHKEGEHNKGEHNKGEHNKGEHNESEHKESEHKEGEHKESEDNEGENKEEENKEGEHNEGGHKQVQHNKGEHTESEHKEGEHKESEHNEGENKEEENKEGEHKQVEHKEGEHNKGEHKEGENKEEENKEGENKEGENKEGENNHVSGVTNIYITYSTQHKPTTLVEGITHGVTQQNHLEAHTENEEPENAITEIIIGASRTHKLGTENTHNVDLVMTAKSFEPPTEEEKESSAGTNESENQNKQIINTVPSLTNAIHEESNDEKNKIYSTHVVVKTSIQQDNHYSELEPTSNEQHKAHNKFTAAATVNNDHSEQIHEISGTETSEQAPKPEHGHQYKIEGGTSVIAALHNRETPTIEKITSSQEHHKGNKGHSGESDETAIETHVATRRTTFNTERLQKELVTITETTPNNPAMEETHYISFTEKGDDDEEGIDEQLLSLPPTVIWEHETTTICSEICPVNHTTVPSTTIHATEEHSVVIILDGLNGTNIKQLNGAHFKFDKEITTENIEIATTEEGVLEAVTVVDILHQNISFPSYVKGYCSEEEIAKGGNCICSTDYILDLLKYNLTKKIHLSLGKCPLYLHVLDTIVIGKNAKPEIRVKRSHVFTRSINLAKEISDKKDIEIILTEDEDIRNTDIRSFVISNSKLVMPCVYSSEVLEKNNTPQLHYTWVRSNGKELKENVRETDGSLVISNVSSHDSDNYTCFVKISKDDTEKAKYAHEMTVMELPLFKIKQSLIYEMNVPCTLSEGDTLYIYLPKVLGELLCGFLHSMCKVEVFRPICLNMHKGHFINVTIIVILENLKNVLPFQGSKCDIHCRLKLQSNIGKLFMENVERISHIKVDTRIAQEVKYKPVLKPNKTKSTPTSFIIGCPAGFGIQSPFKKICSACSKGTYNPDEKTYCIRCTPGYYQPLSGAKSCIRCASPLDSPDCLRVLYSNTGYFGIYVATAFGFVIFLLLAICLYIRLDDTADACKVKKIPSNRKFIPKKRKYSPTETEIQEIQPLLEEPYPPNPPEIPPLDF